MSESGPDNFKGLVDLLPRIGGGLPELLSIEGMTGNQSLLNIIFPNAEQLMNSPWWAKFIEHYLFKSPISALMQNINLNLFNKEFWSNPILPGIINLSKNNQRSR